MGEQKESLEIERKFLVKDFPEGFPGFEYVDVKQGYLLISENENVRLRLLGDTWFITVKKGRGLSREEYETPISEEAARTLWPATGKCSLEKRRYYIPLEVGVTAELDIFEGRHRGKVHVEVEFATEEEAISFKPPRWFGEEVTGDPNYGNSYLAKS